MNNFDEAAEENMPENNLHWPPIQIVIMGSSWSGKTNKPPTIYWWNSSVCQESIRAQASTSNRQEARGLCKTF